MKKLGIASFLVMALMSCGKESPKLTVTPTEIALYAEGTTQITTNANDATFAVEDDFYASVESNGLVTANKVGETEIIVNSTLGTANVPVVVLPQYTLYPDVDGLVGKSTSAVVDVMGNSYETSTSNDGELEYIYYNPTSYCDLLGFTFSGGRCNAVVAFIPTEHTTKITKALIERYNIVGMQNDYYFFSNHDENVTIALTVYTAKYIGVVYMESTKSKGGESISSIYDELSKFNHLI